MITSKSTMHSAMMWELMSSTEKYHDGLPLKTNITVSNVSQQESSDNNKNRGIIPPAIQAG